MAFWPRLSSILGRQVARMRKWLPASMGGRVDSAELAHRVLGQQDLSDLLDVMGAATSNDIEATIGQQLAAPDRFCLGTWYRGRLVACVWVSPQWATLGIGGTWMGAGVVRRGWRGRGLGTYTYASGLDEARRRGLIPVLGNVRHNNLASLAACRAVGLHPFDEPEIAAKLQAHLGTPQILVKAIG